MQRGRDVARLRYGMLCRIPSRLRVPSLAVVLAVLCLPVPASAYSVLAHQAAVDAMWEQEIVPLLHARFPQTDADGVEKARAFAYGGAVIQDLGYYPLGSHLFTNLTHYVRSGDFVKALIGTACDVNEYAFGLGALAHYESDTAGHPLAVNRVVPMLYPGTREEFGDDVLYVNARARHVMVEFAFDVSQVARGAYIAQELHRRIGFEVAEEALARAFHETYGLELKDVLLSVDLAVGTYRYAVGKTIPEMTRLAWRDKREEIERQSPGMQESVFVYSLSRAEYDRDFGTTYRKPGLLSRLLAFIIKIVPKVGPFRPLAFTPLPQPEEELLVKSVAAAHARYRTALQMLGRGKLDLENSDFDTGNPPVRSRNPLVEKTYADLLEQLEHHDFEQVPDDLRAAINAYYSEPVAAGSRKAARKEVRLRRRLAALNAAASTSGSAIEAGVQAPPR
ncbi:MAG TPA: zinc dependent phospholipase C family protein [Vicinamibacterales bacterium]|nr:zinc dependent phospholipase C family protein [Vicinamibacterales bacterium]